MVEMTMAELSVIVPIYNCEEYLLECLKSISRAIEGIDAEVLLIEDSSTDSSRSIAEQYAEKHKEFSVYALEQNGGLSKARNYGVKLASGNCLSFIDSDDLVYKTTYQMLLRAAEYHHADLVSCNVNRIKDTKISPSVLHQLAFYKVLGPVVTLEKYPQLVFDTTVCNKLFRKNFYLHYQFSFPEGKLFEDSLLCLQAFRFSKKTVVLKQFGYIWRIRTGKSKSISQVRDLNSLDQKLDMMKSVLQYAKKEKMPDAVILKINYKYFLIDFHAYIEQLLTMQEADAQVFLKKINAFIYDNMDLSVLNTLPAYDQQKIICCRGQNVAKLRQLMNYKKANYNNANVFERNGAYYLKLNESIFKPGFYNARNEFGNYPLLLHVDKVEIINTKIILHMHMYAKRISISECGRQRVQAFLFNDITGNIVHLKTEQETCLSANAAQEKVFNYDDYTEYSYNYSGSGIRVEIDLLNLRYSDRLEGNNLVVLQFEHPIDKGIRIVRGMEGSVKASLNSFRYQSQQFDFTSIIDDRQTVMFNVKKRV